MRVKNLAQLDKGTVAMNRSTEHGQSYVEYGILLALIALAALLALAAMGVSLENTYETIVKMFNRDQPPSPTEGYQTSFDGDLKDWIVAKYGYWKGGEAEIKRGRLELEPLTMNLLKSYSGKDYDLTLTGPQINHKNPTWNGFGLLFRADATGKNGYMFEIEKKNPANPTQLYFSKWVDGKQYKLTNSITNAPDNFDWKNMGNMQVTVRGDTMTAYLGGKQIVQTRDTTFTQGQVGIASNAGSELSVDAFSVTPK